MSNAPRAQQIKRDWGDDDTNCHILHVDMDSFYAQVEIAENPQYRGKPLIVGHDAPRSVVTAATYDLKVRGIYAGMPVQQAKRIAPHAIISASPRSTYLKYSEKVMRILCEITPQVEQISIDEAFLDISGARRRLGNSLQIAALIRSRIREEVGLPASIGIAENKSVAKIASAHAKPDGILLIPQAQTQTFLRLLPVGAIWGVGRQTQASLAKYGIETVAQLADLPIQRLVKLVGKAHAYSLHALANGIDKRRVGAGEPEKSISTENTFATDIKDATELHRMVVEYSYDCARRLRAGGWLAWNVSIKVRAADFTTVTRGKTLRRPTDLGAEIAQVAQSLLDAYGIPVGGVRLLGVKVDSLQSREDGIVSFLDESDSRSKAERVMDQVSAKFGADAVKPASLLKE
ncbi:ImpB/MucB/SamB family protein [Gleimia coleocanis DSM 15436]|uniref:DNA polymerase IV n=1 Tax=Gleimia coleocanis DSM 15436 TaxID=525245 RepID=C0W0G3_9ACTO|nr:DNA polymerase IV [Gleimia coleocanis]EEH64022.1 ImpB/MucB/SamB family protein [Gleimia coleocanis DSM 15436]